jgi:branched-chain amino acid transport system permease protein
VSERIRTSAGWVAIVLLLAVPPYYLDEFWLRLGLSVAAAGIGAIGLTLLTGTAGQLSLAHAFFLGVGAVTYCVLAAPAGGHVVGLDLPTPVAAAAGVLLAGWPAWRSRRSRRGCATSTSASPASRWSSSASTCSTSPSR